MTLLQGAVLVTGNANKLEEARRICGEQLEGRAIDLPEIQSLDLFEVLHCKGEEAWTRLLRPLLVEDTGLELEALNGFPGPLVKSMLAAIGPEGIARLAASLGETGATARTGVLYRDAERTIVGEGAVAGRLVLPGRGAAGFGWDPVFEPLDSVRTYAEMDPAHKDLIGHRGRAWRDLLDKLGDPRPTPSG